VTSALVICDLGVVAVDLEAEEVVWEETPEAPPERPALELGLPLVVTADRHGSTVIAVVDRRPPMVVSGDGGLTWRETGAGLPPGRAVAISPDHPDDILYATESRLFLSHDGGRFWTALGLELPEVVSVHWTSEGGGARGRIS
jgi:hypothetical protein